MKTILELREQYAAALRKDKLMSEPVILVENLTRRFGDFVAVDHINFQVNAGEVVGYLGPNGSGKTTTIRMLLGLQRPVMGHGRTTGGTHAKTDRR